MVTLPTTRFGHGVQQRCQGGGREAASRASSTILEILEEVERIMDNTIEGFASLFSEDKILTSAMAMLPEEETTSTQRGRDPNEVSSTEEGWYN